MHMNLTRNLSSQLTYTQIISICVFIEQCSAIMNQYIGLNNAKKMYEVLNLEHLEQSNAL